MITVAEAARLLCRNPETIRRWIRSGRLRAQKLGTQHMIDERALEIFRTRKPLPVSPSLGETATGEPMPDILAALGRSRRER